MRRELIEQILYPSVGVPEIEEALRHVMRAYPAEEIETEESDA